MSYLLTILIFLILVLGSVVYWSVRNGISPMPSSRKARNAIQELLPPEKKGKLFELGAGWGTLAIPLAKGWEGEVTAYETSPIPWLASVLRARMGRIRNLEIVREDFHEAPLQEASVIVCYLFPGAMRKLKGKFERELRPGTVVISNTFAVPGWIPEKTVVLPDLYRTKIYLYRIPPIR